MKALVSSDALLAFPDHTQPFDVKMDACEYQLGSVIKQNGRPIVYYSRKLNSVQRNYMTIEKKLLSIIKTFKEFCTILLGSVIWVHTNHKNLTHRLAEFTTQRVLRWCLLLEEFTPTFLYKARPNNILADALSHVPTARTERESTTSSSQLIDCLSCYCPFHVEFPSDQAVMANCWAKCPPHHVASQEALGQISPGRCPSSMIVVQPHQEELFLEHPVFDDQGRLPFQYKTLYEYQQEDPSILALPINKPQQFQVETMGSYGLVCHYHGQHNCICLTDTLLPMVVNWFHKVTAHNSSITRLQETLRFHYNHPKLLAEVSAQISHCNICQRMKRGSRQYGLLAPHDAKSTPWSNVATDCIGPWVIELHGGREYSLCALTTINVTTNLLEIEPILTQTAVECARAFENGWLLHCS